MPRVTALIPNYNRHELLRRALMTIERQTAKVDYTVVVDNGSDDASVTEARSRGAYVIELPANVGFAAAVNRGIEHCRTDWIAILNNDVALEPTWLEVLLSAAQREKSWFAAGKVLKRQDPRRIDATFDLLSRAGCAWRAGSGLPDRSLWNQGRRIAFAPFTAVLVRAELFERVGDLDEAYGSYMEDVDFGLRCTLRGYHGWYEPKAVARHEGSATFGRWDGRTVHLIARNQILLMARHYPPGLLRRWLWPALIGQLFWGAVAARHGAGAAYVAGKWEGLKRFRRMRKAAEDDGPVRALIEQSESELIGLQRQVGFDTYWRLYHWFTR